MNIQMLIPVRYYFETFALFFHASLEFVGVCRQQIHSNFLLAPLSKKFNLEGGYVCVLLNIPFQLCVPKLCTLCAGKINFDIAKS